MRSLEGVAGLRFVGLSVFELALRVLLWFAIASLAMVPYWRSLRRYRAMTSEFGTPVPPGKFILDVTQANPRLERARWLCIRACLFGVVMFLLLSPLLFFFLNR
jgi:hypothetical protein